MRLSNQDYLLVNIFRAAWTPEGDADRTPKQYLKSLGLNVRGTGRLFEYLGLAKMSKASALGWEPTNLLLRVIAQQAARRRKDVESKCTQEDEALLRAIVDAVKGQDSDLDDEHISFGFELLEVLGLLQSNVDGDQKPTKLLCELIQDRSSRGIK